LDDGVRTQSECFQVLVGEVKLDRLAQISADLVQRSSLRDDGDFEALADEARLFAWPDHRLDGSLQHSALHLSPMKPGRDVRRAHPTQHPWRREFHRAAAFRIDRRAAFTTAPSDELHRIADLLAT
jgi:hypothetical protein